MIQISFFYNAVNILGQFNAKCPKSLNPRSHDVLDPKFTYLISAGGMVLLWMLTALSCVMDTSYCDLTKS